MTLQSSQRLPELLFYTKKSYKILQAPILAPILHVHITLQSREFSIQNPILHTEDKELFEYYYYIQRAKEPSFQIPERNSMHRRQGDLLEMHPCVLQDIPMTFQPFQAIHDLPAFLGKFYNVPVSPGNPPHSSILRLECIFYIFHSSIGFQKTPPSTSWAITNITNIHSSKKGRCCDIGQIDRFFIIELFPFIVLSSDNTNCKNDIQLFHQLFDELSVYRDYH